DALKDRNAAFAKAMAWQGRQFHDHHHLSDYQLTQTAVYLRQILPVLVANQKPAAVKDVESALDSINIALTEEAPKRIAQRLKNKEAHGLAEAWVLLAATEHKDAGHR